MSFTDVAVKSDFAIEVEEGLSANQKFLSSKYFYDETGDKIFQAIMHMPEYYLTNSEYEILEHQTPAIIDALEFENETFELIEFGAGDGHKTNLMLKYLLDEKRAFKFIPIDISQNVLHELERSVLRKFPAVDIHSVNDDYFSALAELHEISNARKCVLFMGSNIGNFLKDEAVTFLHRIYDLLDPGDKLMIGFDLKKDPKVIARAYDDPHGNTRAFNLNLLRRMNRELGATFDLEKFDHYPVYDPETGAARSYLVSMKDQKVYFESLDKTFYFDQWELIYTEISQKYSLKDIHELASLSGFQVKKDFFDSRRYFVDSLWVKA